MEPNVYYNPPYITDEEAPVSGTYALITEPIAVAETAARQAADHRKLTLSGMTMAEWEATEEPLYIAHRGCGTYPAPEETLEAMRMAYAAGLKAIQFHVFLLRDGSLGVIHDETVNRTTTSTGNVADYDSGSFQQLVIDDVPAPVWSIDTAQTFTVTDSTYRGVYLQKGRVAGSGSASKLRLSWSAMSLTAP